MRPPRLCTSPILFLHIRHYLSIIHIQNPHSASKRLSLRRQHRIKKLASVEAKKLRRDSKNTQKRNGKNITQVPNNWPLKQQMLMDHIRDQELKKDPAFKRQQLEDMVKRASLAEKNYDMIKEQLDISKNYHDGSLRAFVNEFKKVVSMSDVILQVLDARDPIGTRCPEVERQILAQDPKKKIVFVLNKIDLVPRENLLKWMKTLRNEFPTVAFKSATIRPSQRHRKRTHLSHKTDTPGFSEYLGAKTLISLLKNYTRSCDIKVAITVGVIGIPNVGKSSLINSLKCESSIAVSSVPGRTRIAQEVALDSNIKLLDCPGIIFRTSTSQAECVLQNAVNISTIKDCIEPVELIISRCDRALLMRVFAIQNFNTADEFLVLVAKKFGKLKAKGVANCNQAAKLVLEYWNTGKIPRFTEPPKDCSQISASIVPAWCREFDLANAETIKEMDRKLPIKSESQYVRLTAQPATAQLNPIYRNIVWNREDDMNVMEETGKGSESEDDMFVDVHELERSDTLDRPQVEESKPHLRRNVLRQSDTINPRINQIRNLMMKRLTRNRRQSMNETVNNNACSVSEDPIVKVVHSPSSSYVEDAQDFIFAQDFWTNVPQSQIVKESENFDPLAM